MVKRRMILLALAAFGCVLEAPRDYVFTDQYMLLPVEFRVLGSSHSPSATWCVPIESLEVCIYTEGERIRIGYSNRSPTQTYRVIWSDARYVDESGRSHRLEVFPPDLAIPEEITPGANQWNAFVPLGKRYFKEDGGYYHVEWLLPWDEGRLSEDEAKRRVEEFFATQGSVRLEIPVILPDGLRVHLEAKLQLVAISDDEFWIRYAQAKAAEYERDSER